MPLKQLTPSTPAFKTWGLLNHSNYALIIRLQETVIPKEKLDPLTQGGLNLNTAASLSCKQICLNLSFDDLSAVKQEYQMCSLNGLFVP